MRRVMLTAVVFLVAARMLATAQKAYPVFTEDDLVKMMKAVGQNVASVNASIAKNDIDTAKARLARSREQLATTITFWRNYKKDDAVELLKDTVRKMDDLDAALSVDKVDLAAVNETAMQIDAACQACHAVYREQDPVTKAYRLKSRSRGQ
jgi:cytochrome c556